MSYFDIIDRRQPKPAEPKAEAAITPMPRLSLNELEALPADFDPRTDYSVPYEKLFPPRYEPTLPPDRINADLMEAIEKHPEEFAPSSGFVARKKPGRPPKVKP